VTDPEQPRIRAKLTNDFVDYLHNDLSNAAFFFRNRINKAFEENDRTDGIFLDMMAAITMTAFALEGYVNFVGYRLLKDNQAGWNDYEKKPVKEKIKEIRKVIGVQINWNMRPYTVVDQLIDVRNMLAHPKEHRAEPREWIAVGTHSELQEMLRDYRPEYERKITQSFMNEAYDDVEAIWCELREAAKIPVHETWSGGSQGFELIAHMGRENKA
jgi:hypothetical protein